MVETFIIITEQVKQANKVFSAEGDIKGNLNNKPVHNKLCRPIFAALSESEAVKFDVAFGHTRSR